jgi:hypothetical protein
MNRITAVNALRAAHPALADGAYQARTSTVKPSPLLNTKCKREAQTIKAKDGWVMTCYRFSKTKQIWKSDYPNQVPGWSRFDADTNTEYVVLANTSDGARTVTIPTSTPSTVFSGIFGSTLNPKTLSNGKLTVKVPARTVAVFKANAAVPAVTANISSSISFKQYGNSGHPEITAKLTGTTSPAVATFVYRTSGEAEWQVLGADDNSTYRMVVPEWAWDVDGSIDVAAVIRTPNGRYAISPALTIAK